MGNVTAPGRSAAPPASFTHDAYVHDAYVKEFIPFLTPHDEPRGEEPRGKVTVIPSKKPMTPSDICGPGTQTSQLLYRAPEHISKIIRDITKDDPIPCTVFFNIIGSESEFKPDAKSPTGVRAINQMTFPTLLEQAYKHKEALPAAQQRIVENNIERYVRNVNGKTYIKYRIKAGGSKKAVRSINDDARAALILAREYLKEIYGIGLKNYKKELLAKIRDSATPENTRTILTAAYKSPEFTAVHLKSLYTFGPGSAHRLLSAYADPSKHHHQAPLYIRGASARHNAALLYTKSNTAENPRTVRRLYEYLRKRVGNDPINMPGRV